MNTSVRRTGGSVAEGFGIKPTRSACEAQGSRLKNLVDA
jgi:hypothetical protein